MQAILNQLAVSFDLPILDWIQAHMQSSLMDTIMPIITLFGEGGIFWIAWAVLLLLIPKTRKTGLGMAIALVLGLLVCNVTKIPAAVVEIVTGAFNPSAVTGGAVGTMLIAIAWHLKDMPQYDINDPEIGLVHRIDKDTSGLLVVAKTAAAKTSLGLQFFNKTTKREYNALVWGNFTEDEGRIEGNIGRDPKDRMRMAVFPPDSETGKSAVTHYYILERFGFTTLVKCVLETGRTHQIRAHMKHIGHPLFCDERYGGDQVLKGTNSSKYRQFIDNCFKLCPRQVLHAKTLGFMHPRTGKEMMFNSELPEDIQSLLEKWRGYVGEV